MVVRPGSGASVSPISVAPQEGQVEAAAEGSSAEHQGQVGPAG
jgi:hypothetical protein